MTEMEASLSEDGAAAEEATISSAKATGTGSAVNSQPPLSTNRGPPL
ncbi:hypothetical protein [Methylobacterium gregans]